MKNSTKRTVISIISALLIGYVGIQFACIPLQKLMSRLNADSLTQSFVAQILEVIVAAVLFFIFKSRDALKVTPRQMKEGLICGAGILVPQILVLLVNLSKIGEHELIPGGKIAMLVVYSILIGISEEILYRGILTDGFLELIGTDTQKKTMLAVAIPGLIFGSLHLINAASPDITFATAAVQAATAAALGMFFGAVYVRCGRSLWPMIVLHAIVDFAGFVHGGMLWGASDKEAIGSLSLGGMIMVPMYLLIVVYLLRSSKIKTALAAA